MHLLTLWPCHLTFQPQNHTISMILQGHSLVRTLWDILFLSYALDKETDKQTEVNILPTPTGSVGVGSCTRLSPVELINCYVYM